MRLPTKAHRSELGFLWGGKSAYTGPFSVRQLQKPAKMDRRRQRPDDSVLGENSTHYVPVNLDPEGPRDNQGDKGITEAGIPAFQFDEAWMSSADGPFGPGLPRVSGEYSRLCLRSLECVVKFQQRRWLDRDGLLHDSAWSKEEGGRNQREFDRRPKVSAQFQGWQTTWSCCLSRRFSATMPLTPSRPSSSAIVAKRWTRPGTVFLISAKGRAGLLSSARLWWLLILEENY